MQEKTRHKEGAEGARRIVIARVPKLNSPARDSSNQILWFSFCVFVKAIIFFVCVCVCVCSTVYKCLFSYLWGLVGCHHSVWPSFPVLRLFFFCIVILECTTSKPKPYLKNKLMFMDLDRRLSNSQTVVSKCRYMLEHPTYQMSGLADDSI